MTKLMKAVQIRKYGGPYVLTYEDVPRPQPMEDELLIRVHAAGVNPADWKTRSGKGIAIREQFPVILGWDVSGVVEEMGNRVSHFKLGDAVYGMVRFPKIGGTYAEYVTSPAVQVAHKPLSLDHIHAAALPLVALTAWQALFEAANLSAKQIVLIHGAAGGVGHIALQLARWKGAYVIGTCSSRNVNFLSEIGADEIVNYKSNKFENVIKDVDVVLDTVGGKTWKRSLKVLRENGLIVSLLRKPSSESATFHRVRSKYILVQPNAAQLAEISKLVDAGYVKPAVDNVIPLKNARKAHRLSEKGHTRGKIVLRIFE